jgi:hypothetical protein
VGPRAVLDAVSKRNIPSPRRDSNPDLPPKQIDPGHFEADLTLYECVSRSFRTGRLERILQMVQLSAIRCS